VHVLVFYPLLNISTCFGHLYAHHQEIQMRSTAYSCLSCCSCCDATTGQTTIGSGTHLDLLMMGIKMPETCWDTIDYQWITICCILLVSPLLTYQRCTVNGT